MISQAVCSCTEISRGTRIFLTFTSSLIQVRDPLSILHVLRLDCCSGMQCIDQMRLDEMGFDEMG